MIKSKIERSISFSRIHYLWYSIILLFPSCMIMKPVGERIIRYRVRCKNKKTFYFLLILISVCSLLICSTVVIGLNQGQGPQKKTFSSSPIIITSFEYTFNPPVSETELKNVSIINSTFVYESYQRNFNETVRKQAQMIGLDEEYQTIDITQFKTILNHSVFKEEKYIKNFSDCDDYAFKVIGELSKGNLSGLAVGLLFWITPPHAEPFFIDEDGVYWVILGPDRVERVCNLDRSILNLVLI